MPIEINRQTGEVRAKSITEEQRELLWETVLRTYIRRHPEVLEPEATEE